MSGVDDPVPRHPEEVAIWVKRVASMEPDELDAFEQRAVKAWEYASLGDLRSAIQRRRGELFGPIKYTDVDDPKEFLRSLSMSGRGDPLSPGWLYRGERDAKFPVLPSVFRRYLDPSQPTTVGRPFPLYSEVVLEEVALLHEFMELADQVGLPIPGASGLERLRETIAIFLERSGPPHSFSTAAALWPTSEFIPLMALARHHGLPTRLMDCSYSWQVAAYFAAEGAAAALESGSAPNDRLAVWRIASECVHSLGAGKLHTHRRATRGQ